MLKKAASGVLAGHCRLTISAAFTSVPCLIRHGVNLRGSTYRSVRLSSALAAVLLDSLFEHPEITDLFLDFDFIHEISGFTKAGRWNITILFVM